MVRRWSRLKQLNNLDIISTSLKIELFKSAVHYKKFSFKITKFKRKKLTKWKHRGQWYPFINVFKFWIKDYTFNKNLIKYNFLYSIFSHSFIIFNSYYIQKKTLPLLTNPCDFNSIAVTKKLYFYLNKNLFKQTLVHFNQLNTIFAYSNKHISMTNEKIKILTLFDNSITYESKNFDMFINESAIEPLNYCFMIIKHKIVEIYKILNLMYIFFLFNVKLICF